MEGVDKAGTHLVVWGTDNTCFVPMNFPHCRSNPPGWSEQEAACCYTKARGDRQTLSVEIDQTKTFPVWPSLPRVPKLTACLGVVSWKQRPFGLCLDGIGRGPVLTSDWSRGWMTTEVSGVWWTRSLICTENRIKEHIRGTKSIPELDFYHHSGWKNFMH